MKVLHITAWWPTRVHPTHGNFIQKHVRLVAREHEVVVVAVQEDRTLGYGQYEIVQGYEAGYYSIIVYFGKSSRSLTPISLAARIRAYSIGLRLSREVLGRRPDLIHGHILIDGGIIAAVVARWWRKPHVITEHATIYQRPGAVSSLRVRLGRWACHTAARVLPVSNYLATMMQEHYHLGGLYTVVPNVVDSDTFQLTDAVNKRPHTPLRLLHISNFHPQQKNVAGILRVYGELSAAYPGCFHLHIAGDGDMADIRTMVNTLDVDPSGLTLSGPHTEQDIARLMAEVDAFILFSNYETQGVVLLEALSCGIPCIATAVGGVTEVIAPGENGFLVPAANEAALFQAIVQLADTYTMFDPIEMRNLAVQQYSDSAVLANFSAVYGEVTVRPPNI